MLVVRRLGIFAATIILAPAFTYVVRAESFTPGAMLSGLWDGSRHSCSMATS